MSLFNPDHAFESQIREFATIPLKMGRFLIASDTRNIFYDLGDKRIQLTDIITLDTEAQREAILAPLDKFYFVRASCTLWRYANGEWQDWPSGGSGGSRDVHYVLTVAGWGENVQYNVPIEGLTATQNGIAVLSQGASQAEREAAANADMYISGQADGSLTITRGGDKPTCDIPITVILLD